MRHLIKYLVFITVFASHLISSSINDDLLKLRTTYVAKVRYDYKFEIDEYKARLNVADNLALLALAKDKLEKFEMLPSDPDWAVLIHNVLMGYGFDALPIAADVTTKETVAAARMYSAAYMQVLGNNPEANLAALQGVSGVAAHELENYVAQLNAYNSAITDDFRLQIASDAERLNSLRALSSGNAWFAHERFWAVAGVLSPDAAVKLKDNYAAHKGTGKTSGIEFLVTLTAQLNGIINSLAATPTVDGNTTRAMVALAQQILLTITAGTPEDAAYVRLCPANESDWQNIRKALFLALSVSENPAHGGHTFLSTVYDLGRFYHSKTDADQVKEYYWRLEAYGNAFTSLWENLSASKTDAQIAADLAVYFAKFEDPLYRLLNCDADTQSGMIDHRCVSEPVYRRAYKVAFANVTAANTRSELANVLGARAKLKYAEAFNEAYPTYTAWSEFHTPSDLAIAAASGARLGLNVPAGFKTAQVKLDYAGGKWVLKAVNSSSNEHILWSQASTAKQEFFGELKDQRGTHLYGFEVEGTTATIRIISAGYEFAIRNDAVTVVVNNGDNSLGVLESSAFPSTENTWNDEDNAITIKADKFIGQRGMLTARRGGVLIQTQDIALGNKNSVKKRHSNGCEYDHFSAGGQGIYGNRFITLFSDKIDIGGATLQSSQSVQIINPNEGYTWSLASIIDAPYVMVVLNLWHLDTQLTYAGIPGVDPCQAANAGSTAELNRRQAALTMNHDPMVINYARDLHYFLGRAYVLNDSEFTSLLGSPHAYGRYWGKENMCPTFTSYTTVTVMQPSGGGGSRGGSGFGGMGGFGSGGGFGSSGFSGFGQHGNLGGSALVSMAASSVHVSNADFSVSNRGGAVNVGGSMTLSSMLGSTTMGFGSSHGAGGSSTTFHSTFTPPSMHQAAAMIGTMGIDPHQVAPQQNPMLMLHGFNEQTIQLLTQQRNTHSTAVRMAP